MHATQDAGLAIARNGQIVLGSQGKWASERLVAALSSGNGQLTPEVLRTNSVLRKEEWVYFDNEVIEGALPRLRVVSDLIAAGLTKPLPGSMGKTILQYDRFGDLADATISMNGMVRTDNDRPDWTKGQLPIPITHKDWFIDLRELSVSRNGGEGLDTTMARLAGRKCAELQERIVLLGSKQFAGLPIYGLLTHPARHTLTFGTGGAWESATKSGDQFLADVQSMLAAAAADGQYGPFNIYVSQVANMNLDKDFKANGSETVRERILKLDNVNDIKGIDFMPVGQVAMIQMLRDTVVIIQGEPLQTVQWDINGGFGVEFKAFQIQVPLIRATPGQSGIVHMTT